MKRSKLILALGVMVLLIGVTSITALAASDYSGAMRSVESRSEVLQIKKDILNERVANGTITREKADEIINALEENQLNCDGTGSDGIGRKYGAGFGGMMGKGQGGCSRFCGMR